MKPRIPEGELSEEERLGIVISGAMNFLKRNPELMISEVVTAINARFGGNVLQAEFSKLEEALPEIQKSFREKRSDENRIRLLQHNQRMEIVKWFMAKNLSDN